MSGRNGHGGGGINGRPHSSGSSWSKGGVFGPAAAGGGAAGGAGGGGSCKVAIADPGMTLLPVIAYMLVVLAIVWLLIVAACVLRFGPFGERGGDDVSGRSGGRSGGDRGRARGHGARDRGDAVRPRSSGSVAGSAVSGAGVDGSVIGRG